MDGVQSLETCGRLVLHSFGASAFNWPIASGSLLILASGPSLKASLPSLRAASHGLQFLSVNDFYKEDSFVELKPRWHVIADPLYWDPSGFEAFGAPLIENLRRCTWPVTLFVPNRVVGTGFADLLARSGIAHVLFRNTPVAGYRWLVDLLFHLRLGMPKAQNVLVAAIGIAMWLHFTKIGFVGADHSWHEEIFVDDDNVLCTLASHSYGESVTAKPFLKPAGMGRFLTGKPLDRADVFSMREILQAWATVHRSYETLQALAVTRRVGVYNCSAKSYVDAFPRQKLESFLG
jgi:hypothetical protein